MWIGAIQSTNADQVENGLRKALRRKTKTVLIDGNHRIIEPFKLEKTSKIIEPT